MILQPQDWFTVVRQIGNHTDSGTYYVRAVIRNAYSDAIIATLDLDDKGSQRFKKDWHVAPDQSGQGFYVSIVTSVYTDSGYTTKSENYADEENTYLVQERVLRQGGGGGISAYDVRRILQEELGKLPKPEKVEFPEVPKPTDRTDEVLAAIKSIDIPKPEKPEKQIPVDLSPVIAAVEHLKQVVEDKEVTPETDLTPILEKIEAMGTEQTQVFAAVKAEIQALPSKVEEVINNVEINVAPTKGTTQKKAKEEEAVPFDIKQLAL